MNLKIPDNLYLLIPYFKYQKSIPINLKIPGTVFCLFTFSNIKKVYLQILKYLAHFYFLIPYFKY